MKLIDQVRALARNNVRARALMIDLDNVSHRINSEEDESEKSILLEREDVLLAMLKRELQINA